MARFIGFLKVVGKEDGHTFMVRIGTSWYEMSRNADQPNGVCIYSGEAVDNDRLNKSESYTGDLARGMVRQIMMIVEQSHSPLIQAANAAIVSFDTDQTVKAETVDALREALEGLGLRAKS